MGSDGVEGLVGLDAKGFWFDLQAAVYGVVIEQVEDEWLIFPGGDDSMDPPQACLWEGRLSPV